MSPWNVPAPHEPVGGVPSQAVQNVKRLTVMVGAREAVEKTGILI